MELKLKLDERCPDCRGNGSHYDEGGTVTCGVCNGRGRILTELGEELLDFCSRWLETEPTQQSGPVSLRLHRRKTEE
ncbi:hypothetical protein Rctr197k_135 [Virus Rctr197k]|nr:hypothetical protein Rctr197k_135 [Virus Rctr197k]